MPVNFGFQPPGVYIQELNAPIVNSIGTAPTLICLVGDSQRATPAQDTTIVSTSTNNPTLAVTGQTTEALVITQTHVSVGGTWTLTIDGNTTTPLAWNATAATIATAVTALTLGYGTVVGTGGPIAPGTPVTITFGTDPFTAASADATELDAAQTPFVLTNTGPNIVTGPPIDFVSGQVYDRYTGYVGTVGVDYNLVKVASTDGNVADYTIEVYFPEGSALIAGASQTFPNSTTQLASGTVTIAYNFTNAAFYTPYIFTSFAAMSSFYGAPLGSNNTINSALSLAGYFAFLNGAVQVMALSVNPITNGGGALADADWNYAFQQLQSQSGIDAIVPIWSGSYAPTSFTGSGSGAIEYLQQYIATQATYNNFSRAFIALDGTVSGGSANPNVVAPVAASVYIAQTGIVASDRIVVVAPSVATFNTGATSTSSTNSIIDIGGQYIAAAAAGVFAAQAGVQVPLTRKQLIGFYNIPSAAVWSTQTIVNVMSAGNLVVAQNRQGNFIIQQGLTTDMTNFLTQEISIQAAEDKLFLILYENLNNSNLIGQVLNGVTSGGVLAAVASVLNQAVGSGLIQSYNGLTLSTTLPSTVSIAFQYQPSVPLNFIQVVFGIDLNTGQSTYSTNITSTSGTVTS